MKLEFNAPAGSSQTQTVLITNPSARALEAVVQLADWTRDSLGNIVSAPPGSLPHSCAGRLRIFPGTNFTLAPGDRKELTLMMDLSGQQHLDQLSNCMLFITQVNPQTTQQKPGGNVQVTVRVGVQLFYIPPGAHKKDIEILNFKDTASQLLLTLQNNGELETDGKVGWELTDEKTGTKVTLPEAHFYTLPGATRLISLPLPESLPPGKYSVTALVDYGREEELKIGELEFIFAPPKKAS